MSLCAVFFQKNFLSNILWRAALSHWRAHVFRITYKPVEVRLGYFFLIHAFKLNWWSLKLVRTKQIYLKKNYGCFCFDSSEIVCLLYGFLCQVVLHKTAAYVCTCIYICMIDDYLLFIQLDTSPHDDQPMVTSCHFMRT